METNLWEHTGISVLTESEFKKVNGFMKKPEYVNDYIKCKDYAEKLSFSDCNDFFNYLNKIEDEKYQCIAFQTVDDTTAEPKVVYDHFKAEFECYKYYFMEMSKICKSILNSENNLQILYFKYKLHIKVNEYSDYRQKDNLFKHKNKEIDNYQEYLQKKFTIFQPIPPQKEIAGQQAVIYNNFVEISKKFMDPTDKALNEEMKHILELAKQFHDSQNIEYDKDMLVNYLNNNVDENSKKTLDLIIINFN